PCATYFPYTKLFRSYKRYRPDWHKPHHTDRSISWRRYWSDHSMHDLHLSPTHFQWCSHRPDNNRSHSINPSHNFRCYGYNPAERSEEHTSELQSREN